MLRELKGHVALMQMHQAAGIFEENENDDVRD